MRTREEIMKRWDGLVPPPTSERIKVEILLDIRELLEALVKAKVIEALDELKAAAEKKV